MNDAIRASEFNISKALGSLSDNSRQNRELNNSIPNADCETEALNQCSSAGLELNPENVDPLLDPRQNFNSHECSNT